MREFLHSDPAFEAIEEATSANEALRAVLSQRWDLILLDICLPGRSGLDILRKLVRAQPNARILVVSALPEEQFAVPVVRAGAHGYLGKDATGTTLLLAANTVLAGGRYLGPRIREALAARLCEANPPLELSFRELQILLKIATGGSSRDIATELGVGVRTAARYRMELLRKLDFKSVADATRYAHKTGLIP